jgi:uncharacterized protein YaaQ
MADNVTILIGWMKNECMTSFRSSGTVPQPKANRRAGSGKLFGRAESSLEVIVGGATIFVVDIEHFERV